MTSSQPIIEIDLDDVILEDAVLPERRLADATATRIEDRPGPLGAVIGFALVAATFGYVWFLAM